jgi:murein L,D-transpeptidase YafK
MKMKKLPLIFTVFFLTNACQDVKNQVSHNGDRVAVAYEEKEAILQELFVEKGIKWTGFQLFFRVFKHEEELEIWAKNTDTIRFTLVKTYTFCTNSGKLGPKRKEGDFQIPEGFYKINRFNPKSSFHLSLGVDYPNKSDLLLGDKTQPGSDIFIHGACVSVGCISITDDKIKEVYLLANEAKKHGQNAIEVHFFPMKLNGNTIEKAIAKNAEFKQYESFWNDLKIGYDFFEEEKRLFEISIDENGKYRF